MLGPALAHPDKGFGRIWETQCLKHAAAYPMVATYTCSLFDVNVC